MKAVVKNGEIQPQEPFPEDWTEGTEVQVEKSPGMQRDAQPIHPADAWMDEVERCAAQQDPDDDLRLQRAIDEERRLAKELAHRGKL